MHFNKCHYTIFYSIIAAILLLIFSCNQKDNSDPVSSQVEISDSDQKLPAVVDFNFHVRPILSDRCYTCHGPDKAKIEANLSFASYEMATKQLGEGSESHFAVVPGKSAESTLVDRIYSQDPALIMPPPESNLSLSTYEKDILKKWIDKGAKWKPHWAFLPLEKKQVPTVSSDLITHNEIDNFILDKLKESPLGRSNPATKEHLIRRLAFDITGLPPTLEEINQFVDNEKDNALDQVMDHYLSTDAYAENMTAQWMDIARYADTHGYQDDFERIMWPWRDWVIHSYKNNMPYDQFVTWQLAGDLLPKPTKEQIIATAFNRNHSITMEGGVILEEYRSEYVSDRANTFGKAFLGLTVECAKCHDHKYDPISQVDYYSLYSYFNNLPEMNIINKEGEVPEPYLEISAEEIKHTVDFIKNLDSMENIQLMVMEEMKNPRQTYVLDRGMYDQPTTKVGSNVPAAVLPAKDYPKNRLGLSQWLFDSDNPLTARVAVNRIWQMCFGQGLVSTAEDFGAQGSLPSHPELLDHLAYKYMDEGWDTKAMIKYILSSYTYQQSTNITDQMLELDPENKLYARAPRIRLSAEKIRDHALATSGLMTHRVGGPSVKPYQPEGLWKEKVGGGGGSTAEYIKDKNENQYRRSLYTFWKRTVPPPGMTTFDAVSRDLCMVKRETTSTPLQALVMMNNPEIIEASRNLAYKAIAQKDNEKERIALMFKTVTSRDATENEVVTLKEYLESEKQKYTENTDAAEAFLSIGDSPTSSTLSSPEVAAYAMVANVIYNLDESITRS